MSWQISLKVWYRYYFMVRKTANNKREQSWVLSHVKFTLFACWLLQLACKHSVTPSSATFSWFVSHVGKLLFIETAIVHLLEKFDDCAVTLQYVKLCLAVPSQVLIELLWCHLWQTTLKLLLVCRLRFQNLQVSYRVSERLFADRLQHGFLIFCTKCKNAEIDHK